MHLSLYTFLREVARGNYETQPDHYYYSAGIISGKFYITPDEQIIEKQANKDVSITKTLNGLGDLTAVSMRDAFGNSYSFSVPEVTHLQLADVATETTPETFIYDYNSTLHLNKITSLYGKETLTFNYETETNVYDLEKYINNFQYMSKVFEVAPYNNSCQSGSQTVVGGANSTTKINNRRFLSSIERRLNGELVEVIEFISSSNDCVYADITSRKLDTIRVKRGVGGTEAILDFVFKYDCSANRLMLKEVQQMEATLPGKTTLEKQEPYKFSYISGTLPNPSATASMDHWGYYNGAGGNSLVPNGIQVGGQTYNGGGNNRNTNFNLIKTATLSRIDYPTGGHTKITLEPNRIPAFYSWESGEKWGGGLRVKNVENYDSDDTRLTKKSFRYLNTNNTTSGKLLSPITYDRNEIYNHYDVNNVGGGGINYTCNRVVLSATNRSHLGAVSDNYVGYSRVEEIVESNTGNLSTNGKTVYHFKNNPLNNSGEYEDISNGLVEKVNVYNATGDILSQTLFDYSSYYGETRNRKSYFGYIVTPQTTQSNKVHFCLDNSGFWDWRVVTSLGNCSESHIFETRFESKTYPLKQWWLYKTKQTEKRYFYDDNNTLTGEVETITDYDYNDTFVTQPTETRQLNSDGKEYKTTTQYLKSYDLSEYPLTPSGSDALLTMNLLRMHAYPLVQTQYIDNQLVYQTKLEYKKFGLFPYPHKFYEKFPNTGDLLAEVMSNYDGAGNLLTAYRHFEQPNGGIPLGTQDYQSTTLLYSHQFTRMAAQVQNAQNSEVAFTSFETQAVSQGNWVIPSPNSTIAFSDIGRTGNGYFLSSSNRTISKSNLPSGKYLVTYYTKSPAGINLSGSGITLLKTKTSTVDAQGWYFVEQQIEAANITTLNVVVNGNTRLDELRLFPIDALMTTFSYDKDSRLLLSMADENSIPARFEYDALLRLTGTKNFEDYYLQLTEYLYKNTINPHNTVKNWTVLASGQTDIATIKGLNTSEVLKNFAYFDGIGRPTQAIAAAQSPTGNDMVQFTQYDEFGRQVEQHYPYTISSTNEGAYRTNPLSEQQAFISTQYDAAEANFGLAKTVLEASPLNRVFEQIAPGSDFQSTPSKIKYDVNGIEEVRDFYAIGGWYAANDLYKTTALDEDGKTIITYTDKIGRKIMQDQAGAKTYFLYNDIGLLEQVIQPETAEKGHTTDMLTTMDTEIQEGSFLYTYDAEHRMKTKVVPGCQAYTYYYDDLDQLVMTEDGNGFKTFTKYDRLGRPIITGRYTGNSTPSTSAIVYEERITTGEFYTTNQSFPTDGAIDIYTVSYYDDYDFNNNNADDVTYQPTSGDNYDDTDYPFVRGKPTGGKVAILNNNGASPNSYLFSSTFYDKFNRPIQTKSDNHLAGTDITWAEYNFPGWLLNSRREHTTTINSQTSSVITNESYTYDDIGRQLTYTHQLGDHPNDKQQVCAMSYNERNELSQKKIGNTSGNNYLQTIDYNYNIRKWLTTINDVNNLGSDLFAMNLDYIGNNENHNGNISKIEWNASNQTSKKTYAYTYDNLNRLTSSLYSETSNANHNDNGYNTSYEYDRNGNIKVLGRNGRLSNGFFGLIDYLTYNYNNEGNLTTLAETRSKEAGFKSIVTNSNGSGAYTYDENGNMLTDEHKGIAVTYNFLNLPTSVTKNDGSTIQWLYDATGNKLQKSVVATNLVVNSNPILSKEYKAAQNIISTGTVISGSNVTFTAGQRIELNDGFTSDDHFVGQIQSNTGTEVRDYLGNIEYINSSIDAVYFAGGRIKYLDNNTEYQYVLVDYQGNTRVLFKDNNGSAEVVEDYSGYYPFGAVHEQQSDYSQKYLFGGKELQTELDLGWSDFEVRCMDNWSGRFLGIDILAEVMPDYSPYCYGFGKSD